MPTVGVMSRPKDGSRDAAGQWLAALARLVSPSFPADAAEAFAAFRPLLAALPAAAFNADTLDAAARCAERPGRVPTYAEVRAVLADWQRDHAPHEQRHTTPLPAPPTERITPEQADAILAKHGWTRRGERLVPPSATTDDRPPVKPSYVTGAALAEARRRAGIIVKQRGDVT